MVSTSGLENRLTFMRAFKINLGTDLRTLGEVQIHERIDVTESVLSVTMAKLLFDEVTYQSLPQGKKPLFLFQWLQRLPETIRQCGKVCLT